MQNIRTSVNLALSTLGLGTNYTTIATKNVGGVSKAFKIKLAGDEPDQSTIYLIYENNKAYFFAHVHNGDTDPFFSALDKILVNQSFMGVDAWGTSAGGQHRRGFKVIDGLDDGSQTAVMVDTIRRMLDLFETGLKHTI